MHSWFTENRLSFHFNEDQLNPILFTAKREIKEGSNLEDIYNKIRIK